MHKPRWKKWLFAGVKLGVLAILLWFLRDMLTKAFSDLSKHEWHLHPAWLLPAALCYVLGLTPVGLFWHGVLRGAEQETGLFETLRAWWISQVFKYIPGKAMVLVIRTGMLRNPRIETTVVAASVFVETLTMMAVGSLVSFIILTIYNGRELLASFATVRGVSDLVKLFENSSVVMTIAALAMFVGMALPTWPPLMKRLLKLMGVGKLNPTAADKLGKIPYRTYLLGWLFIGLGWFIQGLGLWCTLRAIGVDASLANLPMNTATLAMSTVAGFLSFIPGGVGVREAVQAELMVKDYGDGMSVVASIFWRLVMLAVEVILAGILYWMGPHRLRHKLGGEQHPPAKPAASTGS